MNGRHIENILLLLLIPAAAFAQDPGDIRDRSIELLKEGKSEEQVEAFCEEYSSLLEHPLNLNTASQYELEASGLLNSYQVDRYILYRNNYGFLLSIYELEAVDGFSKGKINEILPYVVVSSDNEGSHLEGTIKKAFRGNFLANGIHTWPGSDAISPSPVNNAFKINCTAGRGFSSGLAYQKDPGEKVFGTYGPEHLCGHVSLSARGALETLVLGSYRLHNGLGLLMGRASFGASAGTLGSRPFPRGIRSYAGNCEWGIHQGLALGLRHHNIRLRIWSSWQQADLSLHSCPSPEEVDDWRPFLRSSGLHVSESEIAGRNLVFLGHTGMSIQNIHPRLFLGIQYLLDYNGLTRVGRDSLALPARILHSHRSSFYGRWMSKNLSLFWEVSPEQKEEAAALVGLSWIRNDYLKAEIQAYYYGREFQDIYSGSYSRGTHQQDEQGLLLGMKAEVLSSLSARLILELSNKTSVEPEELPRRRLRESLILENSVSAPLHWRIRLQRVPGSDFSEPGLYRMEARYNYSNAAFRWQSAIVLNTPGEKDCEMGQALLQAFTLGQDRKIRFTTQLILFRVPDWEQRIYFYRPDLYRQFSFPAYSGSGYSLNLYTAISTGSRLTLEVSMSRLKYNDRGIEEEGERIRLGIQLRVKL